MLRQAETGDRATTTAYTLNTGGRRQTATTGPTGGAATSTTTRHYTDTSDNPAWIDKDGAITRSTQSLSGDLGASIAADGSAALPLNNSRGDTLTTITIPPAQDETTPCTAIGAWSDYTEFGTPRDAAATTTVGGPAGYGWLGAKERSTTTESAGLTLMGDRLYNGVTGRFTSPDPEPGGSATAYGYPTDPINQFLTSTDTAGHGLRRLVAPPRVLGPGGASTTARCLASARLSSVFWRSPPAPSSAVASLRAWAW